MNSVKITCVWALILLISGGVRCEEHIATYLNSPLTGPCGIDYVDAVVSHIDCVGNANGSIELRGLDSLGATVTWDNGATGFTLNNLEAGIYAYEVAYDDTCTVVGSVSILEPEPISFEAFAYRSDCPAAANGSVILTNINGGEGRHMFWINDEVFIDPFFSNLSPGTYEIWVTDRNDCISKSIEVQIESGEKVKIEGLTYYLKYKDESIALEVDVLAGDQKDIVWRDANGIIATGTKSVTVNPSQTTKYSVHIGNGICGDQLEIIVEVVDIRVYLPNAFSPNGDGLNDIFKPEGDFTFPLVVQDFKIYNRLGGVVFERNQLDIADPGLGWDGSVRKTPLPDGIYAYAMCVELPGGRVEKFTGTVQLIR